jgi:hypothetical protein
VDRAADGVVPGGAGVLDPGHRDVHEPARVGEEPGREAVHALDLAEPGGLDVIGPHALVDGVERRPERAADHVLDALVEQFAERDHPGADDGHFSHACCSSGWTASGWKA